MSTRRRAPAASEAATRSRVPCSITRRDCSSRPCRIATRWTTASQPSTARRRLSASVMSPSASSQPQAARVSEGLRTRQRTGFSAARSPWTTFGPTNPDRTITVAVACRKLGAGKPYLKLVRLRTKPVIVPVEGLKHVVIPCPKGTLLAGAGLDLTPPKGKALAGFNGSPLELRSQSLGLKRLTFEVRNADSKPHAAVLYGNCVTIVRPSGSAPGWLQVEVL